MKMVIIVDDDESFLETTKELIKEENNVFLITTKTAEQALNIANAIWPDLIITDLRISGGMSGVDLKKNLSPDIPVILCSASVKTKEIAKREGFIAFLTKPFDIEDFLGLIKNFIGI